MFIYFLLDTSLRAYLPVQTVQLGRILVILLRFLLDDRSRPLDGVVALQDIRRVLVPGVIFSPDSSGATFFLGSWGFPALAKAPREVSSGEEAGEGKKSARL